MIRSVLICLALGGLFASYAQGAQVHCGDYHIDYTARYSNGMDTMNMTISKLVGDERKPVAVGYPVTEYSDRYLYRSLNGRYLYVYKVDRESGDEFLNDRPCPVTGDLYADGP